MKCWFKNISETSVVWWLVSICLQVSLRVYLLKTYTLFCLVSPQHHHDGFHGNLHDFHLLQSQRSLCQTQELPVPRRWRQLMNVVTRYLTLVKQHNTDTMLQITHILICSYKALCNWPIRTVFAPLRHTDVRPLPPVPDVCDEHVLWICDAV